MVHNGQCEMGLVLATITFSLTKKEEAIYKVTSNFRGIYRSAVQWLLQTIMRVVDPILGRRS